MCGPGAQVPDPHCPVVAGGGEAGGAVGRGNTATVRTQSVWPVSGSPTWASVADYWQLVDGVLHKICTGVPWRDLPAGAGSRLARSRRAARRDLRRAAPVRATSGRR
ncbi:hypothetical protein CG736_08025 [Kitasatospora sp. CB02891]|nr:hypothetical protein CG736_08025 [Kitasatospora sp. CB02891]